MTIRIAIGQKTVDNSDPEVDYVTAELEEGAFAPRSDGLSGSTNTRLHGAGYNLSMIKVFGLLDWERDNFSESDPAWKIAEQADLDLMRQRREAYIEDGGDEEDLDYIDFYIYWIDWALENCPDPIISIE